MIVGVLAQDQVMGYELMIPGLVFGMAKLAAMQRADNDSPQYEVRVCGQSPSIRTVAGSGRIDRLLAGGDSDTNGFATGSRRPHA
jgi:hypothetical protein